MILSKSSDDNNIYGENVNSSFIVAKTTIADCDFDGLFAKKCFSAGELLCIYQGFLSIINFCAHSTLLSYF